MCQENNVPQKHEFPMSEVSMGENEKIQDHGENNGNTSMSSDRQQRAAIKTCNGTKGKDASMQIRITNQNQTHTEAYEIF